MAIAFVLGHIRRPTTNVGARSISVRASGRALRAPPCGAPQTRQHNACARFGFLNRGATHGLKVTRKGFVVCTRSYCSKRLDCRIQSSYRLPTPAITPSEKYGHHFTRNAVSPPILVSAGASPPTSESELSNPFGQLHREAPYVPLLLRFNHPELYLPKWGGSILMDMGKFPGFDWWGWCIREVIGVCC
eukprot:2370917-Pyramimonas_sp.AAC.2